MQVHFARFAHASLKLVLNLIIVVFYNSYLCAIPFQHTISFHDMHLLISTSTVIMILKYFYILLMKECIYEKIVSKVSQSIYSSLNTVSVLVIFQLSFFSKYECFKGCQGHQVLQGCQGALHWCQWHETWHSRLCLALSCGLFGLHGWEYMFFDNNDPDIYFYHFYKVS